MPQTLRMEARINGFLFLVWKESLHGYFFGFFVCVEGKSIPC